MFSKIQHVSYLVEDLDATVAWYQKAFGARYVKGGPISHGRAGLVRMGNVEMELIEPSDRSELAGPGEHVFHHVGYVVDDLDKSIADFKARGYKFRHPEPVVNIFGYRVNQFDTESTNGTRILIMDASSLDP